MNNTEISKKHMVLIMISLMISLLLSALDSTIVGTAMPKIIGDLHGMELYSWPFTAYMLSSTLAIIIFGKLSDLYGRKPVILTGIIIFLISSVLCGLSGSMIQLILFRGAQGIGGGILVSSVYIIVGDMFPPAERGKYTGIVSSVWGLSSVIGPAIGGVITDFLSWRWVFYVNIPIGLIALFLVIKVLPDIKNHYSRKVVDFKGIITLILLILALFSAMSMTGNILNVHSPRMWLTLLSVILFYFFLVFERKAKEPVLPLSLFSNQVYSLSSIIMFLSSAAMFCGVIYIPLFVQTVLGITATESGGIMTPMMIGIAFSAMLSGQLISITKRYKVWGIINLFLTLIGCVLLSTIGEKTSGFQILIYSTIFGIGSGGIIPVFNISVQNAFTQRELGVVTSSIQFFRNIGASIGTVVFSLVMNYSMETGFKTLDTSSIPQSATGLLRNPRTLADKSVLDSIQSVMPEQTVQLFTEILLKVKAMFVHSIHLVFIASVVIILLALIANAVMKEIPLKRHQEYSSANTGLEPEAAE